MPFTPAHLAAVLPLRGRLGLPFAALAAGSLAPDLAYFLPMGGMIQRRITHSMLSVPTWDLVFGLALWIAWRALAPIVNDLAPQAVRERWRTPVGPEPLWWKVALAVMIGAATHVLWDSFTHPGYWATTVGPLAAGYPSPIGTLTGYKYLQYSSGVLGLAAVLWFGWKRPLLAGGPRRQPLVAAIAPVFVLAGASIAVITRLATQDPASRQELVVSAVTASISGGALSVLVLCVIHSLADNTRTLASSADQPEPPGGTEPGSWH